jgi:putative membrane-bound dehydrogenase-like protein
MADYPLGMDGNGKPGGRVVMLEDTNDDGRYDKRTVIADGMNFPTGILTWRDGALVTAAPDVLYLGPTGEKKVLLTGFSTGNQQLRVNGLRWGMDGWVYCAAGAHNGGYNKGTEITSVLTGEKIALGSRDFRFKPDTGEFDPQSGPSQFGRAKDDWGHWFGVQNSFPLWHYVLQDHYLRRNPYVIPPDPVHQLFSRNPPVYPASSLEKRYHSFGESGRFTSACGIEIYRDQVLFDDGKTHAFTCEPFHNVVQHHVLEDDGVTFKATRDPAETKLDFLVSEDRWCRPVMVRTGPDGALWVADMYRYMIEHPQWLPQNGKDELLPHYREGDDKGRIWRVVRAEGSAGTPARSITANFKDADKSVGAPFESPNGWTRDKAQMLAVWSGNKDVAAKSAPLIRNSKQPQTRAQVGWTLHELGLLKPEDVVHLLQDKSARVREQALIIAENFAGETSVLQAMTPLAQDADAKVRMQLACSLGAFKSEQAADALATVLKKDADDAAIQGAALSSALPHLTRLAAIIADDTDSSHDPLLGSLFRCALNHGNEDAVAAIVSRMSTPSRLHEVLMVLDEKKLSLASFSASLNSPTAQAGAKQAMDLLAQAAVKVREAGAAPPMTELQLLAQDHDHRAEIAGMLPALWKRATPETAAALLPLIARLQPAQAPEFLLVDWSQRTPSQRQQIIGTLLTNDEWTLALLERIKSKQVEANACDAAMRARLLKHPKAQVKKLAATVFADSTTAARATVLEMFKPALTLTGDPAKGKAAFQQVCISCHKLDGVGLELGPDLRSVVGHDVEKLMNSILDPSAVIEPGFMAYHCTLKSGEQLYGVIATETSTSLTLKMPGNLTRAILRSDITSLKSTNTSLMPDGLEAALTPQSLADLIAYLKQPR